VVLDRLVAFSGAKGAPVNLGDVERAILALWRSYHRPRLRVDPFQAAGLVQNLRRQGVGVEEWPYTARRYGAMASTLFALLRDGRLALYEDAELLDELANVRLQETIPGQVRIQHDPGRHDDRCVAIGMAVVPLVEHGFGGWYIQVPQGVLPAAPIDRHAYKPQGEPPVPVVPEGAARPVERLLSFQAARRHPLFQGPGRRR
jgi:hypothetical protein